MLLHQLEYPEARQALDHERVVVLAHLEQLHDAGDGAHGVQIGGARIFLFRLALRDHADHLIVADRVLDQRDGLLAAHGERQDAAGEEDAVAQREDGQHGGDVLLVDQRWHCGWRLAFVARLVGHCVAPFGCR